MKFEFRRFSDSEFAIRIVTPENEEPFHGTLDQTFFETEKEMIDSFFETEYHVGPDTELDTDSYRDRESTLLLIIEYPDDDEE